MRRADAKEMCQTVPIGIIPVGENNTLANRYVLDDGMLFASWHHKLATIWYVVRKLFAS